MIEHKVFNSNIFTVLKDSKVFRTLIDGVQKASMCSISVTKECSIDGNTFFCSTGFFKIQLRGLQLTVHSANGGWILNGFAKPGHVRQQILSSLSSSSQMIYLEQIHWYQQ